MNFNNNSAIGENATTAIDISKLNNVCNSTLTIIAGKYENAVSTSNVATNIRCPIISNVGTTYTQMAWVNTTNLSANFNIFMSSWNQYKFRIEGGIFKFVVSNSTATLNDGCGTVPLGWFHYALVYSGTNISIYLNGALQCSKPFTGVMNPMTTVPYLADSELNHTVSIDEFRMYNRSLSALEIALHYRSEFQKYNSTEYRFYVNVTNLSSGTYTYYGWANDTSNIIGQTNIQNLYRCFSAYIRTFGVDNTELHICSGSYQINSTGYEGIFLLTGNNQTLTGDGNLTLIGNGSFAGISMRGTNSVVKNLTVQGYDEGVEDRGSNNTVFNVSVINCSKGIILLSGSSVNGTVNSCNAEKSPIYSYSINGTIKNSVSHDASSAAWTVGNCMGIYGIGSKAENNTIYNCDIGLLIGNTAWSGLVNRDLSASGNTFSNITFNSDGYNLGIRCMNVSNVSVQNNVMFGIGSTGFAAFDNCNNGSFVNNTISAYPFINLSQTLTYQYHNPGSCAFFGELYGLWRSTNNELSTDNISYITTTAAKNWIVANNTCSGFYVDLWLQGASNQNITHDFSLNHWNTSSQKPTNLVDADTYFIPENVSSVFSWRNGLNSTLIQGYMAIPQVYYKINRSGNSFANANSSVVNNVTLQFNDYLIFGLPNLISSSQINISLPTDMQWYSQTNLSITPPSGTIVNAFVSVKNSSLIQVIISNVSGSGPVNITAGNNTPNSMWYKNDSGSLSSLMVNSSGYLVWEQSTDSHNVSLWYGVGPVDYFEGMNEDVYFENSTNITFIGNDHLSFSGFNVSDMVLGINSTSPCDYAFRNAKITGENLTTCLFNVSIERNRAIIVSSYRASGISRNIIYLLGALGMATILVTIYRRRR
jgi:hypothetical protein